VLSVVMCNNELLRAASAYSRTCPGTMGVPT